MPVIEKTHGRRALTLALWRALEERRGLLSAAVVSGTVALSACGGDGASRMPTDMAGDVTTVDMPPRTDSGPAPDLGPDLSGDMASSDMGAADMGAADMSAADMGAADMSAPDMGDAEMGGADMAADLGMDMFVDMAAEMGADMTTDMFMDGALDGATDMAMDASMDGATDMPPTDMMGDASADGGMDAGPDGGATPFAIDSARFLSATQVEITFTDDLRSTTGLDASQFRLTTQRGYRYDYIYMGTTYTYDYWYRYDLVEAPCLGYYVEDYIGGSPTLVTTLETACFALPATPTATTVSTIAGVSGRSDQIVLTLSTAVNADALDTICGDATDTAYCDALRTGISPFPLRDCSVGTVIHYEAATTGNVLSSSGVALANLRPAEVGGTRTNFSVTGPLDTPAEGFVGCPPPPMP
ncbi:MAG: hypothetical protein AAF447_25295 [Myxococcota bacterium]